MILDNFDDLAIREWAEEAAEHHLPHGTPAHAVAITVAARGTRELSEHERATFDREVMPIIERLKAEQPPTNPKPSLLD